MKRNNCDQEAAVLNAARTGQWDGPLKAHVAGCGACRETAQTSRWMLSLAQSCEPSREGIAALPEPGLVWWRAQLAQKQRAAERTQKKLEWIASIIQAVVVLGVAGGFAWIWPRFQGQLPELLSGLWPRLWNAASTAAGSFPALYSSLTLPALMALCAVAIFVVYPFLVEE